MTRIQGADPKKLENAVKGAIADVSSFEGSGRKLGDVPAVAPAASAARGQAGGKPAYLWNGQAVARYSCWWNDGEGMLTDSSFSKPFAARFQEFLDAAYVFLGLYLVSFFSVSCSSSSNRTWYLCICTDALS